MSLTSSTQSSATCCDVERSDIACQCLTTLFDQAATCSIGSISQVLETLGAPPAEAASLLQDLREAGLVEDVSADAVVLTDHGARHVRRVLRRHRLLETFLHDVLGVTWEEVHDGSQWLERGLSDHVERLVDAALGHPDRDPHGHPIPAAS